MKKQIFAILIFTVLILSLLALTVHAAESDFVPEQPETVEVITPTGEDATSKVNGQLALVVYDFWAFWFPSQWVADFPDLFVLLTIVSTLALVFGLLISPTVKLFRR